LIGIGNVISSTVAGFEGRPLPADPFAGRREQALKVRQIEQQDELIRQRIFQGNLDLAQTFLKFSKNISPERREEFKKTVLPEIQAKSPELAFLLDIGIDDESVGEVLENFGVDPNSAFAQQLEQAFGTPEGIAKGLVTTQGQSLLRGEADRVHLPTLNEQARRIALDPEANIPADKLKIIQSRNSPGGKEMTVSELMSIIPDILIEGNKPTGPAIEVLRRHPEVLTKQGLISDESEQKFRESQRLKKMEKSFATPPKPSKPTDAQISRGIIKNDLRRRLGALGINLSDGELNGRTEFIRQTQGKSIDSEGRPVDVMEQVVFKISQLENQTTQFEDNPAGQLDEGVREKVLYPGLRPSQVKNAVLLDIAPGDPSAFRIVENASKGSNELAKGIEKAKVTDSHGALDVIEDSMKKLLGVSKDGKLNVGSADIPGFGLIVGGLNPIFLSAEGKILRQQVQALANIVLKDRSGAAVTTPEFERFKKEFGTGSSLKTEAELIEGLRLARIGLEKHKALLYAGSSNDSVRVYQGREGALLPKSNIFPEGIQQSNVPSPPRVRGISASENVRSGFDPSKPISDDATQEEIELTIEYLKSIGIGIE
jgi:hypothetical protein